MPDQGEKNCWKILKLLSKLAGGKKLEYEIECKDGLPFLLKNVRIEQVDLSKEIEAD